MVAIGFNFQSVNLTKRKFYNIDLDKTKSNLSPIERTPNTKNKKYKWH